MQEWNNLKFTNLAMNKSFINLTSSCQFIPVSISHSPLPSPLSLSTHHSSSLTPHTLPTLSSLSLYLSQLPRLLLLTEHHYWPEWPGEILKLWWHNLFIIRSGNCAGIQHCFLETCAQLRTYLCSMCLYAHTCVRIYTSSVIHSGMVEEPNK